MTEDAGIRAKISMGWAVASAVVGSAIGAFVPSIGILVGAVA